MIQVKQGPIYPKLSKYLKDKMHVVDPADLQKYGELGVQALYEYTPKDTERTATSWTYKIDRRGTMIRIGFYNSNINKGEQIALLIQLGHGTRNGGWVEGIDYINPALEPVYKQFSAFIREEVRKIE